MVIRSLYLFIVPPRIHHVVNPYLIRLMRFLAGKIDTIHTAYEYVDYPARSKIVDSGAFQVATRGVSITLDWLIERYNSIKADYYVTLDRLPKGDRYSQERVFARNFATWLKLTKSVKNSCVLPVIHPTSDPQIFTKFVKLYAQMTDYVAVGGLVVGYGGPTRSAVWWVYEALRHVERVHVLGLGTWWKLPPEVYSVDSSTFTKSASVGYVLTPCGWVHVGKRSKGRGLASQCLWELYKMLPVGRGFWHRVVTDDLFRAAVNIYMADKVSPRPLDPPPSPSPPAYLFGRNMTLHVRRKA